MSINPLLVRAFSQARREEGYTRPEIPLCRPEFLRFYYEDAPQACWVATHEQRIIGAIFGHDWGAAGWIGPLAVSPEWQHKALGQALMSHCLDSLHKAGCLHVGLETSPRSLRNLAFYSRLGMVIGPLTSDMAWSAKGRPVLNSSLKIRTYSQHSEWFEAEVPDFIRSVSLELDYLRLARHLHHSSFGDSYMLEEDGKVQALAIVQHAAISAQEMQGVLRVLALVGTAELDPGKLISFLTTIAETADSSYLAIRVPSFHPAIITAMLKGGWRMVQTHIRMYEAGFSEPVLENGIHLNKWD